MDAIYVSFEFSALLRDYLKTKQLTLVTNSTATHTQVLYIAQVGVLSLFKLLTWLDRT